MLAMKIPLLQIGSAAYHTFQYLRDPYAHNARVLAKFGDPAEIPTLGGPFVITGDPEGVKQIFGADPDLFEVWASEAMEPVLGSASVLLVAGARHKRDRKLLTPPFHGARMRAYGDIMVEVTRGEAARWRREKPFPIQDATQAISLEVILRAVFGITESARIAEFRDGVIELIDSFRPVLIFFRFLRHDLGGRGPWARFLRASKRFDAMIYAEIEQRRAQKATRDDILSMLLDARYDDGAAMSDVELRDQLNTLLLAGHETTATGLAWAMYWLHAHPEIRTRLLRDIDALGATPSADALAQLPYLDAVCAESLRLNPILPDVSRLLRAPMELRGRTLPAGTAVGTAISSLHMREDLYPEPTRFRPERFIERKFSPFEYVPFGGGARRCIGAAFAMYEMKIVLGTVFREHRFRLATAAPVLPVRRSITMGPADGVPMVYEGERRRATSAETAATA